MKTHRIWQAFPARGESLQNNSGGTTVNCVPDRFSHFPFLLAMSLLTFANFLKRNSHKSTKHKAMVLPAERGRVSVLFLARFSFSFPPLRSIRWFFWLLVTCENQRFFEHLHFWLPNSPGNPKSSHTVVEVPRRIPVADVEAQHRDKRF